MVNFAQALRGLAQEDLANTATSSLGRISRNHPTSILPKHVVTTTPLGLYFIGRLWPMKSTGNFLKQQSQQKFRR
jgi:hypothetical protein